MKVSIGPATIVGYLLSSLAAGGTVIAAAEHELAGPGKWLAIISAITAVTTNLGRQLQAVKTPETPEGVSQRVQ
jgi:hypothetical protein